MATWRKLFKSVLEDTGDILEDLQITLSDEDLDREFDASYGWNEGISFYAWSDRYVYFAVDYDGSESVGYVPRHPGTDDKPNHISGR